MFFVRLALALSVSFALCTCAHEPASRTQSPAQALRQLTIETPGAVRGVQVREPLERALREVARDAGVDLRGDGRLALLAERFAARLEPRAGAQAANDAAGDQSSARDPGDVPAAELMHEAQALDLADAALVLRRVQARAADLLPAALRVELPAQVHLLHATHFGLYVLPAGDVALVALSRRPFVLDAVPRQIALDAGLHVRGRRAADVEGAKLVCCDPYAQCRAFALGSDLELDVRLPLRARGTHRVELREHRDGDERTVLAFAVDVGDVGAANAPSSASSLERDQLASERAHLLARLAAFRAERGLAPFDTDPALTQRAEQRCRSDASSDASAAAGSELGIVYAPDAPALYAALIAEPVLQARLLAAERARIGLALCAQPDGLAAVAWLANAPRVSDDKGLASGRVLLAINAHRRTRNAAPLRPDAALTEIAQRAADGMRADAAPDRAKVVARANAELERYSLRYRRVAAVAVIVRDPLEAATLEPALDSGAGVVGIAVADLPARGGNEPSDVAVVLALGWER